MEGSYKSILGKHLNRCTGRPKISYRAAVFVDNVTVSCIKVHSYTEVHNFMEDAFTTHFLTVAINTSEYRTLVARGHGNVYVKLTRIVAGRAKKPVTLMGIIHVNGDPNVEAASQQLGVGDAVSLSVVTMELYTQAAWYLRVYQFGGTYGGNKPLDIAKYLLATNKLDDQLSSNEAVASINYVEEPQKTYASINIPDGTPLLGVFDYLQNRYGIYSYGLGVYLYRQTWHLFRPWDENTFYTGQDKLIIYNVPEEQMSLPDKNVAIDGDTISILATGKVQHNDERDVTAMNQGTGFRVGSIRALELRTNSLTDGAVSETTPNEFVSQSNPNPHRSGVVNAPVLSGRFKDDDRAIVSQFMKNRGSVVKLRWENSLPGVLVPGMGVKFHYPLNNKVITRYGTLIGEVYHDTVEGGSLTADGHVGMTELTVWLMD